MPTTPEYPRHRTRALLRAHLSAASRYGHATRHCPVCHRLQRLAMEPADGEPGAEPLTEPLTEPFLAPRPEPPAEARTAVTAPPGPVPGVEPGGGRAAAAADR